MLSHMALPQEGHLDQLFHTFSYLDSHDNATMIFDLSYKVIAPGMFERQDWSNCVYGSNLKEQVPSDMRGSRGHGFIITAFVDNDHAGNLITRRSRAGFFTYCNTAPVYWISKKQTTIETSTFSSEFGAMKLRTEYIRGLRYKLRMIGIACESPGLIYGDNQLVLSNTTVPSSQLKKKSHSIAYHFVREGCARDEWRAGCIPTDENQSDLLTKPVPAGKKREKLVAKVLHHVYDRGVNGVAGVQQPRVIAGTTSTSREVRWDRNKEEFLLSFIFTFTAQCIPLCQTKESIRLGLRGVF